MDRKITLPKIDLKAKWHVVKSLSLGQKIALLSLVVMLITIPLIISLMIFPLKPRITPATGPITPPDNATPTVAPVGNAPIFITTTLPDAQINKNYRTTVEAYDKDAVDSLTMTFPNLDQELTVSNCKNNERGLKGVEGKVSYITCTVSGKFKTAGQVNIQADVSDEVNTVSNIFTIHITN